MEILWCYHWHEISLAELSHSTIQILGFTCTRENLDFFGQKRGPLTNSNVALIVTGVESECENNTTATEPSANGRAQISELPVLMWQKKIKSSISFLRLIKYLKHFATALEQRRTFPLHLNWCSLVRCLFSRGSILNICLNNKTSMIFYKMNPRIHHYYL